MAYSGRIFTQNFEQPHEAHHPQWADPIFRAYPLKASFCMNSFRIREKLIDPDVDQQKNGLSSLFWIWNGEEPSLFPSSIILPIDEPTERCLEPSALGILGFQREGNRWYISHCF